MNKPIHPAVAEHVMEENARLRGLLTRCDEYLAEKGVIRDAKLRRELRAALSQQAEPVANWSCNECGATSGEACNANGCFLNEATPADPAPAQTAPQPEPVARISLPDADSVVGALLPVNPNVAEHELQGIVSAVLFEVGRMNAAPIAQTAPQTDQSGLVPEGYALVPITPTEAQWGGLARDLMMWLDMSDKTAQGLFKHLRMLGVEPPQWLRDEPEMHGAGVPSKGTRVTLIYRAMIEDFLATLSAQGASK